MGSDWPIVKLGDHVEACLGKMLDKKKNKGTNKPYLGNSNVRWGEFDLAELSEMRFEESETERYGLRSGDLIVCEGGEPGRCAIWNEELPEMKIQKALHRLRTKSSLNNKYLYYWFLRAGQVGSLEPYFTGTTIKHLTGKALSNLELRLPSIATQVFVSEVLGSLDEKIQQNKKINQTLEQMAQAIFKSWFVDFDPVKAKIAALEAGGSQEDATLAAMHAISGKDQAQLSQLQAENSEQYNELRTTAELFPSAMQDSELGEIPEGWEVSNFGSVSECFDRLRVPLSKAQREARKGSIPYYGATSIMGYVDQHIFDGIYLLMGEDGSVLRADNTPFLQYIWGKSWVNNHAHVIQGRGGVSTEQLLLFLREQNIAPYVTGAVQLKLNQKNMNSIPFLKAPLVINECFYKLLEPIFTLLRSHFESNCELEQIRDALLPRLLSGELNIATCASGEETGS